MEKYINWIKEQKDIIDESIKLSAARYCRVHDQFDNFVYDTNQSNREAFRLSQGKDLYYDRPGTPLTYVLWYQGRRINLLLKYVFKLIYENRDLKNIEVFDLGAGTGALQICACISLKCLQHFNESTPNVNIINVDTSGPMIDYSKKYLWPAFTKEFGHVEEISCEYSINSWVNPHNRKLATPWVFASYLFDSSDNQASLAADFKKLEEKLKPEKIILFTSSQNHKVSFLNQISRELSGNYNVTSVVEDTVYSGQMNKTQIARDWLTSEKLIDLRNIPKWDERSFSGIILSRNKGRLALDFEPTDDALNLYTPAEVKRNEVKLSDDQVEAATNGNRPAIITGPAGCGKSIVITERIINIIKEAKQTGKLNETKILLTTFNKGLKVYLVQWLKDLLEREGFKYRMSQKYDAGFTVEGSIVENISFMHFDILPTRIWKKHDLKSYPFAHRALEFDTVHNKIIEQIISEVKRNEDITTKSYDNVLNSNYIFDEYHRVIYGLQLWDRDEYLNGERKGRPRLEKNGIRRKLIWTTVQNYLKYLEDNKISSVFTRRHKFLKQLEKDDSPFANIFTHVLVDEFQDCTQSEYMIFYGLISNNNNVVLAGDYAQAIHLGTTADIPRVQNEDGDKMKNRIYHKLVGSYRLPMNISKAIKPISQKIKDNSNSEVDLITPYKGAPPGVRPIFIYGNNSNDISSKIISCIERYKSFDILQQNEKVAILEYDIDLYKSITIKKPGLAETDTILRLKGMERSVIVWSTRINIEDKDEINNFVYTILTRTSCMLIIALYDNTLKEYADIIKQIPESLRIIWDFETETALNKF